VVIFATGFGKDWIKQEAPQVSAELLATVQGNPQPTPSIHTTFQSKNFNIKQQTTTPGSLKQVVDVRVRVRGDKPVGGDGEWR
jgi:hypothetical protein